MTDLEIQKYTAPIDARWVEHVATIARTLGHDASSSLMTRTTTDHAAEIVREIRAKLNCADEKVADAIDAIYRKTAFEVEILVSQLQVIGSQVAADRARAQSREFRGHVSEIIREANSQSGIVRIQAVDAAMATRGMLDQAAEVAAAAEHSALAIRAAAHTAPRLIRALEERPEEHT